MMMVMVMIFSITFRSERMEIINMGGKRITHLKGDVEVKGKDFTIFSESVFFNSAENTMVAKDSLLIMARDVRITADSVVTWIKESKSEIFGNVKLDINGSEIFTHRLIYDHRKNLAYFPDSFVIFYPKKDVKIYGVGLEFNTGKKKGMIPNTPNVSKGEELSITCDTIFLDANKKVIEGYGNVIVRSKEFTITFERLEYFYEQEKGKGYDVFIASSDELVQGDSCFFYTKKEEMEHVKLLGEIKAFHKEDENAGVEIFSYKLDVDFKDNKPFKLTFSGRPYGTYKTR